LSVARGEEERDRVFGGRRKIERNVGEKIKLCKSSRGMRSSSSSRG
jgi:hypothetical protein